ncbi:MAG: FAD-binding oxidoreductase [Alcaligenaceae bacterium]|jgi:D-arginine dehydrogenase|nr:FAD-binding oxidoreductase [Alcaligenaceae bacterium]
MDNKIYDVVIVGGGMAGISAAYRLAPHRSVLILEQESQPAYHTSGRSAAMYMETYGTEQIQALTRAGRQFFDKAVSSNFSDTDILTPRGCIYVAAPEDKERLHELYAELQSNSPDNVQLIDKNKVMQLVPFMRPERVEGAIYEEHAEDIDVHTLLLSFLSGARSHGAEFRASTSLESAERIDGVWHIRTNQGDTIQAYTLVNAAGAWVDTVAERSGVKAIGFVPCRRSAFTFDAPAEVDLNSLVLVVGIMENYYFKPDAGQLLGSPANADPTEAHDVVAEELDIATGIYHIEENTTLKIPRPNHTWAGLRTFAPDNDLVIGEDPEAEGFFWLAGQGGYGIQSAPGVSELVACLILDKPLSDTLKNEGVKPEVISPARFRK